MKSTIRYAIYVRKSTESEDRQVQSIDAQLHELRKIAERENLRIVKVFKESKSAKAPGQRPEFSKMIAMISADNINGILTWQLNRLARNPAESGVLQQMLQDEKIKAIHTFDRKYEPDDNAVIFSVEGAIANQFIRDLRKNVKRGIAEKIRNGGLSGLAPEGYLNNKLDKTVEVDSQRFPLIRKAFDLFLTGNYTAPEILKIMNEDWGYITRKHKTLGGGPMSRSVLYKIFTNPRYYGQIPDPYEDGVMHKANFPAMITEDEFDKVQELLGSRGCPRNVAKKDFALKGLIRCGECGCAITAEQKTKNMADGSVKHYTYYHHTGKRPCSQKGSVTEQDLFSQVNGLLDQYELTPKLYDWGIQALNDIAKDEAIERGDIQKMQFSSIEITQKKLDRLLDLVADGTITSEEYKLKSKSLKLELKIRQRDQQKVALRTRSWYEIIGKTLETLTGASQKFATGDLYVRRDILLAIGTSPVLMDRKLHITPNEWMIPIQKQAKPLRTELIKVRTASDKIQKASEEAVLSTWYTRQDLNLRPLAPQANALSS
jgi:site-specific DNA recombinase